MENKSIKQQQLEALEELYHYSQKLIPAIETIITELKGEKQEDTDEFLKSIINGINWIIEIFNRTKDLVNIEEVVIEKEVINDGILRFGEAVKSKDDSGVAEALNDKILPFILTFSARAATLTNQPLN